MTTEANTGITPAERARLAALLEKATPGPWRSTWDDATPPEDGTIVASDTDGMVVGMMEYDGVWAACQERNAALIVAAVNALPTLLAALDAAEAWQRRIIDAIQPQRPEDPPATLGMDVREAATVVAVLDGLRERARDRRRRSGSRRSWWRSCRARCWSGVRRRCDARPTPRSGR